MKRYIVRAGYVVISFVMLVMTIAAVCRVKSYQNVGTNIGGFNLTGKEINN
ncbi:MAG: hypothetical protein HFH68_02040 [Lachnospiraceae bacterium]|nr:hypothetical protein [Lachnospiraceae bacterium]